MNLHDRPCASEGWISYRYRGRFGWIMIGAKDDQDALRESRRSSPLGGDIANLEIWDGQKYVPVGPTGTFSASPAA